MKKRTVLIVEDETLIAIDLKNRVERRGYRVLPVVRSAAMAVSAAIEHSPDIILMDVLLKGEKTGVDAACEINERLAVPVLFLTGNAHIINEERLRGIRVHKILGKPPLESVLFRSIDEMTKKISDGNS
jgi:two-component system, response regulator PdtaR